MPPTYTLHTPEASFRAFKILIAAEYNNVNIQVPDYNESIVEKLSPTGKAPILVTPDATIFESNSIARFVARLRRDTGLYGDSIQEEADIDSWLEYNTNGIEIPACVWWYPTASYMPFYEEAYQKAKNDLSQALDNLNTHLLTRTYLVNEQITLADIVVSTTLLYPFKFVCDKNYLKAYPNVVRWFTTCVNQDEFSCVIGKVTMCKKELLAEGQSETKSTKIEKKEKKENKDKDTEMKDAPQQPPKKTEHPYKVLDKTSPSSFNMDAWKKTYSNATTLKEAMNTFWTLYDPEGWSLWTQTYNYQEENKRVFMTSNAVGGFQQRTEEIRKWAFGVMHILGTEETSLEIKGVWLLRGQNVDQMVAANDDANWYTWNKLELNEETQAQVTSYWVEEQQLEGKAIQDTKVFK